MAAPLHFIVGPTGAGKTSYARRLAAETGALRFSIDEWMSALFWPDAVAPLDPDWGLERVRRCADLIWTTALAAALAGAPAVLESDFSSPERRLERVAAARTAGVAVRLHVLEAPAEVRWARVGARNRDGSSARQLPFEVTREMFDFTDGRWRPPEPEEERAYDDVQRIAT